MPCHPSIHRNRLMETCTAYEQTSFSDNRRRHVRPTDPNDAKMHLKSRPLSPRTRVSMLPHSVIPPMEISSFRRDRAIRRSSLWDGECCFATLNFQEKTPHCMSSKSPLPYIGDPSKYPPLTIPNRRESPSLRNNPTHSCNRGEA